MQQLTHIPTENPSKKIPGNKPNIYDINIQSQELNKGMNIANTLKGKLDSQQKMSQSWIVTKIKAILKTPIQKFENPIFLFRITHEAEVSNRKILTAFNGNLGAEIAAQNESPVNYRPKFRDTAALENLLLYHKDMNKIINITQQGYR